MKTVMIEIDTNGDNFYNHNYTNNLELYDLIVPKILFLLLDERIIYKYDEIDWEATRSQFHPDSNGHCIWSVDDGGHLSGGYTSASEFTHIGLMVDDDSLASTLSELCDELAEKHGITSWIETRKK